MRLTAARQLGSLAGTRVSHPTTKLQANSTAGSKSDGSGGDAVVWRGIEGEWSEVMSLVARVRTPLASFWRVERETELRNYRYCPTSSLAPSIPVKQQLQLSPTSPVLSESGIPPRPLPLPVKKPAQTRQNPTISASPTLISRKSSARDPSS